MLMWPLALWPRMYSTNTSLCNKLQDPGCMRMKVMRVVQHTSFLPRPSQSVAAMCALTTARAMWQRISRYGVTMPGSVFEITLPLRHSLYYSRCQRRNVLKLRYTVIRHARLPALVNTTSDTILCRRAHPKVAARPWAHDRGRCALEAYEGRATCLLSRLPIGLAWPGRKWMHVRAFLVHAAPCRGRDAW